MDTLCGLLAHLNNQIREREGQSDPERPATRAYLQKPDAGEMDETM